MPVVSSDHLALVLTDIYPKNCTSYWEVLTFTIITETAIVISSQRNFSQREKPRLSRLGYPHLCSYLTTTKEALRMQTPSCIFKPRTN